MSISSPETYKGLLKKAEKLCEKARLLVEGRDADGSARLRWWDDIDKTVESLAEMKGELRVKIEELQKDSPQKCKYEKVLRETEIYLSVLRKFQKKRNRR